MTLQPEPMAELRATVSRLVASDGCAWHAIQTHETLVPFLIEEAAELVDAIERELPDDEIAGELGDVLYQVLFHSEIAARRGEGYDLDRVAALLNKKLIARHPHVFGDRGYMSVEELNAEWERLKEDAAGEKRGSRAVLEGIPAGMPTLARTAKVIERLKRAGLLAVDTDRAPELSEPSAEDAVNADDSMLSHEAAATPHDASTQRSAEAEIGDAILELTIRANALGVDADRALRVATHRLSEAALTRQVGADLNSGADTRAERAPLAHCLDENVGTAQSRASKAHDAERDPAEQAPRNMEEW